MTLYAMTDEMKALYSMPIESAEDAAAFDALMKETAGSIEDKARGICCLIAQLKGDNEMLAKEADRLECMAVSAKNKADRLKEYLRFQMESIGYGENGKDKMDLGIFKLGWQNTPPALKIINEDAIGMQWLIVQPAKIDNAGIKAAIKAGQVVEGAELVTGRTMVIR